MLKVTEKDIKRAKDFLSGENIATLGPKIAELNPINACDNSCLGCWCHSPLLGDRKASEEFKKEKLSLKTIKKLLDDLASLGTEIIQIAGAGEPLLHPDIMEIISYIKEKGMECSLTTSFTLANRDRVKEMVDMKVNLITVSLWAGTPETYITLHPNKWRETFLKIKENLRYLHQLKMERDTFLPLVKIHNVISHLNCDEFVEMLEFSREVGAEILVYKLIDIVPGKTEFLKITEEDKEKIESQYQQLVEKIDFPYERLLRRDSSTPELFDNVLHEEETLEYGRYLISPWEKDFTLDTKEVNKREPSLSHLKLFCGNRRVHDRVFLNEETDQAVIFEFDRGRCLYCSQLNSCMKDYWKRIIRVKFLKIVELGTLIRELKKTKLKTQRYDTIVVESMPCYSGWMFTRIYANGDVLPCCKAHKTPVGNIYHKPFTEVWNGEKQKLFRQKSYNLKKNDPLFKLIGCRRVCDNIAINLALHRIVSQLKNRPLPSA
ncbi:MAG TPA: radical SAM/SPASM domain-containing protein [Candidatus Omnitrophica bacterium]|nr:radical SAM/SPASM domain-containing protein [Candidatus Omnitrophota bacterium]